MAGEAQLQEHVATGHVVSSARKQREPCGQLPAFSLSLFPILGEKFFSLSLTLGSRVGMVLPTVRVGFCTSST